MIAQIPEPLFELGRVMATPAALQSIKDSGQDVDVFLNRHVHGDWGVLSALDALKNDEALATGDRIFSTYRTDNGVKFWIVTEPADDEGERPLTTIILPGEY